MSHEGSNRLQHFVYDLRLGLVEIDCHWVHARVPAWQTARYGVEELTVSQVKFLILSPTVKLVVYVGISFTSANQIYL